MAVQHSTRPQPDSADPRSEQVLEIVGSLYAELHHQKAAPDSIGPNSALERDLGFDSLARVELLSRIERDLAVRLPDATLSTVETLADLMHALRSSALDSDGVRVQSPSQEIIAPDLSRRVLGVPIAATTLNEVLEWRVRTHPGATHAIILNEHGEEPLTYARLHDEAQAVASGLVHEGVRPGSTVALMLPTGVGYFSGFLGTLLAGAIPVPIYPPTRPSQLEEHVHRHAGILANAGVDTLISFPEARAVARLLRMRVPSLRNVLSIDSLSKGGRLTTVVEGTAADSTAMLQYTSGSTGAPKGVILTHANLLANIRAMGKTIQANSSDVFVSWLPLYHDMGLIGAWLGSLYFGCLFVVMAPTAFLARPARWLQTIHKFRGTLSASPNFGYELCSRRLTDDDLRGLDLSCWRIAFNGAEPVLADTLERFTRRLVPTGFRPEAMTPVYGLAEAAVGLTFPPLGRGPRTDCVDRSEMMRSGRALAAGAERPDALRFVSCGQPLAGYQVRVVDAGGSEAPERIEGAVEFSGPSATAGYFRNADATGRLLHGEWHDTGDRGYMAGGELYITGRSKDIIIRRGRHIYPDVIEQAVGDLEGVRKGCVAVFGSTEPATATEKLIVLAETRYVDPPLLTELKARINARVVDSLGEPPEEILLAPPHTVLKTSSGKLRRAATRAAYEEGSLNRAPARPVVQMLRLMAGSAASKLTRIREASAHLAYGSYTWITFLALAVVAGTLVMLLPRKQAWRVAHVAARGLICALRIPFSVTQQADVDLSRRHVIVVNHCSYVDILFLAAMLPSPHVFVAKTELQSSSVLAACLRRIGTVFIERFEPLQSSTEVQRLKEELAGNHSLVIFPEGTFTRIAGLRPFYLGAFQTAVAAGAPIIPITLRGTRSVLRDGQWIPRRLPVSAVVGSPLSISGEANSFAAAVRLRDSARQEILSQCGEPDVS